MAEKSFDQLVKGIRAVFAACVRCADVDLSPYLKFLHAIEDHVYFRQEREASVVLDGTPR